MNTSRPSGHVFIPTLKDQLERSRHIRWANATEEREMLNNIDHVAKQHLRAIEEHCVEQTRSFNAGMAEMKAEAEAARKELRQMELTLRDGDEIDLERWAVLDQRVQELAGRSTRLANQFEGHHRRLSDVLGYSADLQEKYPALNRPLLLPPGRS